VQRQSSAIAAQAREILVVFLQQHAKQSVREDQASEPAGGIDDGKARLAVLDGLPCGVLLVGAWHHGRWLAVHHVGHPALGRRGEQALYCRQSHQVVVGAHRNDGRTVEPPPTHRRENLDDGVIRVG